MTSDTDLPRTTFQTKRDFLTSSSCLFAAYFKNVRKGTVIGLDWKFEMEHPKRNQNMPFNPKRYEKVPQREHPASPSPWSHCWVKIKINSIKQICETGNDDWFTWSCMASSLTSTFSWSLGFDLGFFEGMSSFGKPLIMTCSNIKVESKAYQCCCLTPVTLAWNE